MKVALIDFNFVSVWSEQNSLTSATYFIFHLDVRYKRFSLTI